MSSPRTIERFARAALLIAALTILARLAGFGRNVVFARTVGQTCLGQTYQTVNTIPNIVFEIVAGGALASVVVPLLSGAISRGDREHTARTASALLTWAVAVLTPMAIVIALLARPITEILLDSKCVGAIDAGARMLRIFAPQIVLYGIGVVMTGILQAHRKFGGPAFAPLCSSLVVVAAYVVFAISAGRGASLQSASPAQQLILSVGTTLGVVALSISLVLPTLRLRLRLRPTFRFPSGVAKRARAMALSGVVGLLAQQAAVLVALILTNRPGVPVASINVFVYAQTIYLLPWAIIAVPIATSVYPRLAEDAEAGDMAQFAQRYRSSVSTIITLSAIAAAALIAASREIAYVYVHASPGEPSVQSLGQGIAGFSAGLVGYSIFAIGSRALFALGDAKGNALVATLGWAVVIIFSFGLATLFADDLRVAALSISNAIGVTVLGVALLMIIGVRSGTSSGALVATALGVALLSAAVGWGIGEIPLPASIALSNDSGLLHGLLVGCLRGLVAAGVVGAVLIAMPHSPLRRWVSRGPTEKRKEHVNGI
ncbi:MAG: lipid II flippase MurJ [Antricoccus sp.]